MIAETNNNELVVIGAGLMRTGTTSLQVALQRLLNGKCYHMETVFQNPRHANFWQDAVSKDPNDDEWRKFFGSYKAAVDLPTAAFYQRLMEVYPEAKVILTVRDPRRWFLSVNSAIESSSWPYASEFLVNIVRTLTGTAKVYGMIQVVLAKTLGTDCEIKCEKQMIAAYERHVEEVKQVVPADKLLVFDVREAWQPLCDFLGREVPYEAFPHLNCGLVQRARLRRKRKRLSLLTLLIALVSFYYFFYWSKSYSHSMTRSGYSREEF